MSSPNARRPRVIAHRGASSIAPENTLDAFKLALDLGADGVEMDVHLSSDGTPVVIHDRRVDRTTNGTGRVASLALDELVRLDAGARFRRRLSMSPRLRARVRRALGEIPQPSPTGLECIPTLESTLYLLKRSAASRIYIELKGTRDKPGELLAQTIRFVRASKLEDRVRLISFDHELIALVGDVSRDIRTGILVPGPLTRVRRWPSILGAARRAGAGEVALHYSIATRRMVQRLREEGLEVAAWTANNRMVMRRLLAARVDSIMTNFVDRLQREIDTAEAAESGNAARRKRGPRVLRRDR